jgi:hypothetical protein
MVRLPPITAKDRPDIPAAYSKTNDIYELKLRKRLLAQQMAVLDARVDRVSNVLRKKKAMKQGSGHGGSGAGAMGSGGGGAGAGRGSGPGGTVRRRSSAARAPQPPRPKKEPIQNIRLLGHAAPASEELLERRRRHVLEEVKRRREYEEKKTHKPEAPKTVPPPPNVPQSFFPSRYERGELPCNIVFKSMGKPLPHPASAGGLVWTADLTSLHDRERAVLDVPPGRPGLRVLPAHLRGRDPVQARPLQIHRPAGKTHRQTAQANPRS